jgi:vacuolar-type H+-ATPase subunit I/STV1
MRELMEKLQSLREDIRIDMLENMLDDLQKIRAQLKDIQDYDGEDDFYDEYYSRVYRATEMLEDEIQKLNRIMQGAEANESTIAESDKKEMILKIFNGMSDEEKTDLQREITVLTRGIIVPPIKPGIKFRDPGTRGIEDMPLSKLQKAYKDTLEN